MWSLLKAMERVLAKYFFAVLVSSAGVALVAAAGSGIQPLQPVQG